MLTEQAAGSGPDAEPDDDGDDAGDAGYGKLRYSDADFLRLVGDERKRSIGFGDGDSGKLAKDRIKAQEYRQGVVNDLKVIKGRSQAVDSTLSDAVDTVMPDIMEVFFGGDDVVTFDADGDGDDVQAREESDAVAQVVFGQNDAFRAFNDNFADALLNKTGVFYWWWEDKTRELGSQQAPDAQQAAAMASILAQKVPWAQAKYEVRDDGSVAIEFSELRGRAVFKSVPSEDFTVAADTIVLRDTTYCALRDRPRVQDLIARGVDKVLARSLPAYSTHQDAMNTARDEAGESEQDGADGLDDLRLVETRMHILRVDADDDGEPELWRIETNHDETVLLSKECISHVPFGATTPYLVAHRFYGEGLWDKLHEVMRIKTVLLRMMLDSGYFALNQRMEVSEEAANEFTIADLLNNAPNVPVRSKNGQALRAITAGQLGFDVFNALEFMATVAEGRSGVVRNAQGLNPDTLHETAAGALAMAAAAQKRVRFIVRTLAETGVKDLFLGIHQLLREQSTPQHRPMNMREGKSWKQVQPDTWPEREALTVHVGVGSANRQHDLEVQTAGMNVTKEVLAMQGGPNGPFVTPQNIYNRLKAFSRAMGEKSPELYWTDPGEGPVAPPGGAAAAVNPEAVKAQSEAQLAQQQLVAETQAQQAKLQGEQQLALQKLQGELALQRAEMAARIQLEREKAIQAVQLKRDEMNATIELKREQMLRDQAAQAASVPNAVDALPGGVG